jgi:hypothetical protein
VAPRGDGIGGRHGDQVASRAEGRGRRRADDHRERPLPGRPRPHPEGRAGRHLLRAEGGPARRPQAVDRVRGPAAGAAHG